MKRILCIIMVCILCFALAGCKKIYKGTDELIEKAREEIPISDADTINMQYHRSYAEIKIGAFNMKHQQVSYWQYDCARYEACCAFRENNLV